MNTQTGIWIDTKKAVIVFLEDQDQRVKTIHSGIEKKIRVPGEGKWFTRIGNQFLNFDRKKKAHRVKDTLNYFKEVQEEIRNTDELLIFGPAAMKNELEKYILNNGIPGSVIRAVETADSMTENQMVAWVKKFFNNK